MFMDLVRFNNVTLGSKRRAILSNLSFSIYEGEFFGIVGGGRSGKTTLLRALLGILKPTRGEIAVHVRAGEAGELLPEGGYVNLADTPGVMRFGYVPQRDSVDEVFPLTVRDIVLMGRQAELGPLHWPTMHDRDLAEKKLAQVGISEMAGQRYRALSGDQKQRVLIARALAAEARVMVLDEPVDGMSQEDRRAMVKLLAQMNAEKGTTVIYATRRSDELSAVAQRLMLLQAGSARIGLVDEILGDSGETAKRRHDETAQQTES
jgi:ABC-type Mn2+/Zn2+ transport system ATPase subunit